MGIYCVLEDIGIRTEGAICIKDDTKKSGPNCFCPDLPYSAHVFVFLI